MGSLHEAVAAFDKAIALKPDFAHAHANRGYAFESMSELDPARESYERAVALNADFAEPIARLASLAARRGDWAEARSRADRALALDPNQTIAVLAQAAADSHDGVTDAAERTLRSLLERTLSPEDRYQAMGLLAEALDGQGRIAEAFDAYTAGNAEFRHAHAPRFANAETALQGIGWLTRYFERQPAMAGAAAGAPARSPAHVFLLGFPRSGTTLLEQTLATNPAIVTMEEKEALADSIREFMANPAGLDRLNALPDDALRPYRQAYWRRVAEFGLSAPDKVFIDKLPFHTLKLPVIARLFPHAKILFAVRDPRDVIWSCFRHRFRINSYMYDLLTLDGAARFYDAYMRLWELYRAKLPLDVHVVRHEDVVGSFDEQIRAVCRFIGVEWTEAMRDFAARARVRVSATPSAMQLARGLSREGMGQWRRYSGQLAPMLPILAAWVERFGYPAE
jgi:tetratricopeptide (TPR) repeat protein